MEKQNSFDTIVIGGGPAGMMAAITAAKSGEQVALLERNDTLGKKLLLTGDGRCNLTHADLTNREFVSVFGKDGDFLLSTFAQFGPQETMEFFKQSGLELKTQADGRVS